MISQGKEKLLAALPDLLEEAENGLTPSARRLMAGLLDEWRQSNQAIARLDMQIRQQAKGNEAARRLTGIQGIGEKTATAIVAYAGNGSAYPSGRHFSANLGLVPKEHASGGKHPLGGITQRGNSYIRRLLVQCAWSVVRYADQRDDRLSRWARAVRERRGTHKAVMAVANKLARITWSMLYHQTAFRAT